MHSEEKSSEEGTMLQNTLKPEGRSPEHCEDQGPKAGARKRLKAE